METAVNGAASADLRALASQYGIRAIDDVPFAPLPLADQSLDDEEEDLRADARELSYEVPADDWRGIPCSGEPAEPPRRFIDGSVRGRMVAVFSVGGQLRPAMLACLGALSLELDGKRLVRPPDSVRVETVLCFHSNGWRDEDLESLRASLADRGIRLVASEARDLRTDFDRLRHRAWDLAKQCMEDAERAVLFDQPDVATLVDGLLERRVTTAAAQRMPAAGMVKRHAKQYVRRRQLNLIYGLEQAERSPAFLLETENASFVSWYLRLSQADTVSPSYGIVRLTVSQDYFERRFPRAEERWREVSALSHYLCGLRHRQASYARAGISLEPIVRVEDELHAVLPDIRQATARLHRALGV